jgi:hypothetical protein
MKYEGRRMKKALTKTRRHGGEEGCGGNLKLKT